MQQQPAQYPEVEYWCLRETMRGTILLRCGGGILVLPRKPGERHRKCVYVSWPNIRQLLMRGWRNYDTHLLPPLEFTR